MSVSADAAVELLQKINKEQSAQLERLNENIELLSRVIASSAGLPIQNTTSALPAIATHNPQLPLTAEALRRNSIYPNVFSPEVESVHRTASALSDDDSLSDDDNAFFVTEPLAKDEYTIEGLRKHIREYKWTDAGRRILDGVYVNEQVLQRPSLFPTDLITSDDRSHLSHATIHDVAEDGVAYAPLTTSGAVSRSLEIWDRLKSVNVEDEAAKTVGKITCIREPSPLLYAAIHYTMNKHFNVDELFAYLVDHDPVLVHPHNPFSEDDRDRRTFSVNFEYFTIIGEGCVPCNWQRFDTTGNPNDTHIPITRCSAAIALSLEGAASSLVKTKDRRATRKYGPVYDPFSPWRVLAIHAYPDWETTIDEHDERSRKHIVNGPEAFLTIICSEYRDAAKRLLKVQRRVVDLVEAPGDFIFNLETRDKLLFEDSNFTYSRRYFWAMQTLAIMNQDIHDMVDGYNDVFNDALWQGKDKVLWPSSGDEANSSRHMKWRKRMSLLRSDIESEIHKLLEIERMNDKRISMITGFRDNLFSGTSVMESRRSVEIAAISIEQGHNIRILTLVTIFFLPLTFVTSIYGMTNMPPDDPFYHFGWTTVTICVPTYVLVLSLNTTIGLRWWSQLIQAFSHWTGRLPKDATAALAESTRASDNVQGARPRPARPRSRSTEVTMFSRSRGRVSVLYPPISRVTSKGRDEPDQNTELFPTPTPPLGRMTSNFPQQTNFQIPEDTLSGGYGRPQNVMSTPGAITEKGSPLNMSRTVSYDNRVKDVLNKLRGRSKSGGGVEAGQVTPS